MDLYVLYRRMLSLGLLVLGVCTSTTGMTTDDSNRNSIIIFGRDVTVGTIAATAECTVSHPLTAIKYRLQQGEMLRHINFNPRFLYTGLGLNVASMAPATALQFGVDGWLKKMLPRSHAATPIVSAAGSGIFSAIVSSPIELFVVQLQNEEILRRADATRPKLSARQVLQGLVTHGGGYRILLRGMLPKAFREAGFATGLLWANDEIKEYLKRTQRDGITATIGSVMITGLGVTLVTHPVDTLSTIMQECCNVTSDGPRKVQITTMGQAARILYKEGGVKRLYKGVEPRAIFVTFAIGFMDKARHDLTERMDRLME